MLSRFLGVDEANIQELLGTVRLLPLPYDLTTSFNPGARFGPTAILNASLQVELFNDEIAWDASQFVRFFVEDAVAPNAIGPEPMMADVQAAAERLLETGDFLFSLGGEHSLSGPVIAAVKARYPDLHVVQIDAHGDLRDTWNGSPYSHACVMKRVVDLGISTTQIGIRNFSEEEYLWLKANPDLPVSIWKAADLKRPEIWQSLIQHLQEKIKGPIYFTVDVDGIDPSVIPATGTPEPGGLSWYETLEILQAVCLNHEVVAADVMELAPVPGLAYSDYATARLCYKLLSYVFYRRWKQKQ